jgi:hypothetical protein
MAKAVAHEEEKPTTLTFAQVKERITKDLPVYIKNNSKEFHAMNFIVVLDHPSAEGPASYKVPRSPCPFPITDVIPPQDLLGSKMFRDYLQKGLLLALTDEEYERLATPAAQQAWTRANEEANNIYSHRKGEIAAARRVNQENVAAVSKPVMESLAGIPGLSNNVASTLGGANMQASVPRINQRLTTVIDRLGKDEAYRNDAATILSDVQLMHGDLTQDEAQAIAANHLFPASVRKWAAQIAPTL